MGHGISIKFMMHLKFHPGFRFKKFLIQKISDSNEKRSPLKGFVMCMQLIWNLHHIVILCKFQCFDDGGRDLSIFFFRQSTKTFHFPLNTSESWNATFFLSNLSLLFILIISFIFMHNIIVFDILEPFAFWSIRRQLICRKRLTWKQHLIKMPTDIPNTFKFRYFKEFADCIFFLLSKSNNILTLNHRSQWIRIIIKSFDGQNSND